MLKKLLYFLLIVGLAISVPTKEASAATVAYAVPLKDLVNVYENRTGKLVPMAVMRINQPLVIQAEFGANWWRVKLGNGYGYVYKGDVFRSTTMTTKNVNLSYVNTNTTIMTKVDVDVFDNTSGSLVPMALLKANYRYPVIADSGNFWKVDVGGRIGYVAKVRVEEDNGVPISVPTKENNSIPISVPTKEVSAATVAYAVPLKDLVNVYENRTGKLVPMAVMRINQPLVIQAEFGTNWWRVKLGNGYGYVYKGDVFRSTTMTTQNVNLSYVNTNTTIMTKVDVDVFDNTSGSLVPMAILKANYRYPVIADSGNFWKVDVGGRIGYVAKVRVEEDNGVPILMYHHILTPEDKADSPFATATTTVTTTEFNSQIDYLASQGYASISMHDLERYLNKSVNLPAKSVVITFDDGIISTREYAYPILKQLGFIAEQFIITSRIPATPATFDHKRLHFLSQEDMDTMSDVYSYESHTHNLHSLNEDNSSQILTTTDAEVYTDIQTSQGILGGFKYFAYPFGQYDIDTINTLKSLGFTMAITTKNGKVTLGENKLELDRIQILPGVGVTEFADIVDN